MGQSGEPAGLRAHRSGVVHNGPVARPNAALRRVMGPLLRESGRRKSKALLPGPLGISAICPTSEAAEPRGVREPVPAQVAMRLQEARIRTVASTLRSMPEERGIVLSACASSEVALVESRLCGSRASLNSNCQKTGESNIHFQRSGTLHAASSSTLSNSTNG
jgi:hypothetical protein